MECGNRRGWVVRQRLLARQQLWRQPRLLTLTIDRRNFSSPVAAHREVTSKHRVVELLRALGVKLWVWVLEFQQLTGDGWPHWHILIDVADLPRGRVDLKRAWRLWCTKWGLGSVDLGKPKFHESNDPQHAIMYISKYLTKQPEGGYPLWVMKSRRAIRFVQGCQKLGPLVDVPRERSRASEDPPASRARRSPLLDRMAKCKQESRVWVRRVDKSTGEDLGVQFAGQLPASPGLLRDLSAAGKLPVPISAQVDDAGRESFVARGSFRDLRQALESSDIDHADRLNVSSAALRRLIIANNKYAKREALLVHSLSQKRDSVGGSAERSAAGPPHGGGGERAAGVPAPSSSPTPPPPQSSS